MWNTKEISQIKYPLILGVYSKGMSSGLPCHTWSLYFSTSLFLDTVKLIFKGIGVLRIFFLLLSRKECV